MTQHDDRPGSTGLARTHAEEQACTTGRCGYGEVCACEFYADWFVTPPARPPRTVRGGSYLAGYQHGHRIGYGRGHHDGRTLAVADRGQE